MRSRKAAAILLLTLVLTGATTAQAMLSEEEQKEAYVKRAVEEALGNSEESASETEKKSVTETEKKSATETEAKSAASTESQSSEEAAEQTESQEETETETTAETEAETEPETESEPGTESESDTETSTEEETEHIIVAINPGHQAPQEDMTKTEPVGPGSDTTKAALTEGTSGVQTGLAEYELNLEVSLKLKAELEERGYEVVMTRETNDVDTGSAERCEMVNESGAQILIHIHANRSDDSSVRGASATVPSYNNTYTEEICQRSNALADIVLESYCAETGLSSKGLETYDESAGINWSEVPVMILELGYMTNAEEDAWMADSEHQLSMAEGIADGIDLYFGRTS